MNQKENAINDNWKKEFFNKLHEEIGKYTQDNELFQADQKKDRTLKSAFTILPEKHILVQAALFQLKSDFIHMELFTVLTNDISAEGLTELEKAVMELNYFSPIGMFGIHYGQNQLFLRNCYMLDTNKDMDALMKEAVIIYDIMIEGLQGAYPGLEAVWSGKKTFSEAVGEGLLKKYT